MTNYAKKAFQILVVVFVFSLLAIGYTLNPASSSAQQAPELMVTWQSNNYAPPAYQGKILPIDGSRIDMALELIDNGKIANLAAKEIRWLINGDELKSGFGLKNISFVADGFQGDQEVEITIVDYNGVNLEKLITIPVVRPEVVITGGPDIFRALPYFFNVRNLSQLQFIWSANGRPATGLVENPDSLELDTAGISAGQDISINASVTNINKRIETAGKTMIFKK